MKYIKNGKLVLDGTIRECDLQDKLNKALEIICDLFEIRIVIDKPKYDKPCGMALMEIDKKNICVLYKTFEEKNIKKLELLKEIIG